MRFVSVAAALSVVTSVYAQNTRTIRVGGIQSNNENIYMFSPSNIQASQGDVIQFVFTGIPANHSITQSSFNRPCNRIFGGFDSGWVAIPPNHNPNTGPLPTWNLTITNTQPIWFFCKQTQPLFHCSAGMVGAINAPTSGSNTFDAYMNNARSAGNAMPDQGIGGLVGQGASASGLPGPITGDIQYFGTPAFGVSTSTPLFNNKAVAPTAFGGFLVMFAVVGFGVGLGAVLV